VVHSAKGMTRLKKAGFSPQRHRKRRVLKIFDKISKLADKPLPDPEFLVLCLVFSAPFASLRFNFSPFFQGSQELPYKFSHLAHQHNNE
jgi:hypothetical protein